MDEFFYYYCCDGKNYGIAAEFKKLQDEGITDFFP
jgi:hypothetical protein